MSTKTFTEQELATIATALSIYSDAELSRHSKNLMQRIRTLQEVSPDAAIEFSNQFALDESVLLDAAASLAARQTIKFDYKKPDQLSSQERNVNPMGLCAWQDSWYLVGEDLDQNEIRVFKLERIVSEISRIGDSGNYEIPPDFAVRDYVVMLQRPTNSAIYAVLKVRNGRALRLRAKAESLLNLDDEWDQITVYFQDVKEALAEVLWFGPDVQVLAPQNLRAELIVRLEALVASHG